MIAGYLLKTKEKYKNSKKHEVQGIFVKRIDKVCFQHDMAYRNFKDLPTRTGTDNLITFNIARNPSYDGYERALVSIAYKFFD